MDPSRKRRTRLIVALSAALVLAGALIYTSFSAATEAKEPSDVLAASEAGKSYEVTGKVVNGSIKREGDSLRFAMRDREGPAQIPVTYSGTVPDPFREGREVVVTGKVENGTIQAERDSLVTKCPSKFTEEKKKS